MQYRLKRQIEEVRGLRVEIECLEDLNRTIDELFAELEASGNAALLEELCPYFGVIWPSARALADWLAERAGEIRGRSLLEVGCGLALPSLVAARLGARVTATDFHPEVERFLLANRAINGTPDLAYLRLDWQSQASSPLGQFDWIVGSDILYERQHPPIVARALARHLAPGGTIVVADPARPYLQAFADEMKKLGFRHETLIRNAFDTPVSKEIFLLAFQSNAAHNFRLY
jgi:predicted nicotinamide N-methyase